MTDFMLLGILRMPIKADDGVVAFTQFRSAARSAADRIEALTAERDSWQRAFAAQSAKLQIALDIGGEPVRAALNAGKADT